MASVSSLIERISRSSDGRLSPTVVDETLLISSVLIHVQKLLNVRQGSVDMLADYGLPDYNDLSNRFPYAINEIRNEIKTCITKYEPRLENIRVTHIQDEDDPLNLRFDITARLMSEYRETTIWFETVLDTAGKVIIKES